VEKGNIKQSILSNFFLLKRYNFTPSEEEINKLKELAKNHPNGLSIPLNFVQNVNSHESQEYFQEIENPQTPQFFQLLENFGSALRPEG
jgi:hypothetical protein